LRILLSLNRPLWARSPTPITRMKSEMQSLRKPTAFTLLELEMSSAIMAINPANLNDGINWLAEGAPAKV